jgi:serine/threonine protein kinase/outer membrane protein assembly factor BamB
MELRVCLTCEKAVVEGSRCPECGGAVTLADPAVFVGETFGKYHIDRLIGVGGMGAVFQATHRTLRRPVAVKIVLPQKDDDAFRRRFLREARVLAEVHHPHVVEVYDFDVNDWGISYLVMEFLEGGSLKTRLQEQPRLGWAELGPVIRGVAEGLASAHAAGIVHRDLKPDNIFLATYGDRQVAKVIDFGIAKATTGEHHETQLTRSGYVVGTLAYLAPEQLLGSEVGPATDQYALALVVAEALTGRAVRADKTMGQIISTDIVQPVELPPTVAIGLPEGALAVIRRATAPVPNDRFESVQVFASALDDALAGHTAPSPSSDLDRPTVLSGERPPAIATATATSVTRSPRPGNGRFVALAGGVLAIVAVVFGLVWTTDSGPQHAAPAAAQGPLSVEATIPLPVDAGRLITYRTDLLVAAGADGLLAARPAQGGWTTDRIGLDPDDVLGFTPDNELIRRDEGRLLIHAVAKGAAMPLAERLPEDADLVMAPDSRHVVATRQEGLVIHQLVDGRFERLRTHPLPTPPQAVAIGTRFLVAVTSDVIVWRLEDGAEMLRTPFPDATVVAIAIHDVAGLVAMGGWSDRVLVWDLASGAMTAIPRRFGADRSLDLEFLFHGPTLAVGERGGVTLWTPTDGAVQAWNDADAVVSDLLAASGRLLALDRAAGRAVVLRPSGTTAAATVAVSDEAPWATTANPATGLVLIGGSDGTLHAVDPATLESSAHSVHPLGITSLVSDDQRLATASDDKTIAVWRQPEMTVEWRSRAHDFLVNQLRLDADGQSLWSTSSDGRLKRWAWPDLEELETIDTEDLFGRKYALHAIWMAADRSRALLGTWNRAAVVLSRNENDDWSGTTHSFPAFGGYVVAEIPAVRAVVLAGVLHPYALGALDLDSGAFHLLDPIGRPYHGLVATTDGTGVLAFGHSEIVELRFQRGSDGTLTSEILAAAAPDLGMASAAARLPDGRIAATNDRGELHIFDPDQLGLTPVGRR